MSKKTVAGDRGVADSVYKIFTEAEWNRFQESGCFNGSAEDLRRGVIHLSEKQQVAAVIERFVEGKGPVYVAEFSDIRPLQQVQWEPSAAGESYPHLYRREFFVTDVISFKVTTEQFKT